MQYNTGQSESEHVLQLSVNISDKGDTKVTPSPHSDPQPVYEPGLA